MHFQRGHGSKKSARLKGPCTNDVISEGGGGWPKNDQRKGGCVKSIVKKMTGEGGQKYKNFNYVIGTWPQSARLARSRPPFSSTISDPYSTYCIHTLGYEIRDFRIAPLTKFNGDPHNDIVH